MRMKKLLIIAAAALLAAACAKTYEVKETTPPAIGFGTWTETLTKAINDPRTAGTSTFGVGDSFAVYGAKIVNSPASTTTVFDDDAVEMTAAGVPGTWTYSPTRFWDQKTDSYVFYAISPSSVGTAGTVDPQTGAITSATITFNGDNVESDVLVADKKTVVKTSYGSPVQLDFNHVASLVDFKVNKAPSLKNATVNITGFQLKNISKQGVMVVAANAYTASVYNGSTGLSPVVTWTPSSPGNYPASTPLTVSNISEDTAFADPYGSVPAASSDLIQLVVVPQTFGEPTTDMRTDPSTSTVQMLTISYEIVVTGGGTNTYTANLFLFDFDIVNNTGQSDTKVVSWDTGKHYTFYITLDSTPIVFGAKINDWTVGTGYHYLVN